MNEAMTLGRTASAILLALAVTIVPAFAQESVKARTVAGIAAYNRGDYATAFHLLSEAADLGDPDAQVNLGYMYARGEETAKSDGEALRLYQLSAKQNNVEGMNALGYKYAFGSGVAADVPSAVVWFCKAIAGGDTRAMNNLANLLEAGTGIPYDHAEALSLWRQSSARGDPNAMYNLGNLLVKERTAASEEEGRAWLLRAAQLGQPAAISWLHDDRYPGKLPPPVDTDRTMQLAPDGAPPGKAKICRASQQEH